MESMSNNSTRPLTKFDDENLPPGFRFHPMDEELVTYYLTNKVRDSSFSCRAIAEVDLNKCEPWDLPAKAKMGEKEWYFFSLRDRKYPTGLRTNRATEAGYWKATGKDREIYKGKTNNLVGMKKTLVFYKGRAPKGEKTNWVMHEYRLEGKLSYYNLPKSAKDEWVVTRIFQKSCGAKKGPMGLSRVNSFMDVGSPALPPLLESPYIAGSSDGGTTLSTDTDGMDHNHNQFSSQHVTCFSNAMEPPPLKGFTNKYHSQFTSQNDNNPDSASLDYSFLQSMMQDIGNNTTPQNNYYQQSLMPNSLYGIGGANPGYFPFTSLLGQGAFPPTSLFKSFDDQRLKPCKMEPPSTSSSQWTPNTNASTATSSHQHRNQPSPQSSKYSSQQNQQPMVSVSQDTGLTTEMNTDISSVVTSQQQQLNQPGNSYQDDALADCYGGGWSF